jgi:hypothetical protein
MIIFYSKSCKDGQTGEKQIQNNGGKRMVKEKDS